MTSFIVAIFVITYLGMAIGRVPGLRIDRTGIALLALAALLAGGGIDLVGVGRANIIVAERAQASGVRLSFADFARAGVPMTLLSMAVAVLWLGLLGHMPWN
jgi:Na+/H+ antiporter NhaD/arsenite permease-like protein